MTRKPLWIVVDKYGNTWGPFETREVLRVIDAALAQI